MNGYKMLASLLAANLAVSAGTIVQRSREVERTSVTAHFSRTVGLYPGSSVRVLGVAIGEVTKIVPEGETVRVDMELDPAVDVPADAGAVIIPPSLVSDRYVQLHPPWTGGPTLREGATIPVSRTRVPVELDEILFSIDKLLLALGPDGANADGSLAKLVESGARALGNGNGKRLNVTLRSLAQAITTLADGREDLAGVLTNLTDFTHTLATNDAQVRAVTADLADVTHQLAGERQALEQALRNLAVSLREVGSLVAEHKTTLRSDIESLAEITQTVLKNRESLIEALDTTPLHLANLAETVNAERQTLDIRNDNDQTSNAYDILMCQVLAPILGIECPPPPGAAAANGAKPSRTPARGSRGAALRAPARSGQDIDRFTLAGMLGGAR